ncbi:hypothetical protein [Paenibacillus wenxiniae]|uniref:Uncharacterized protein n=1 Tax=Paenibacillus wenxiniae TaxID=1636843 RepID=A0ABW4RK69_9BACL
MKREIDVQAKSTDDRITELEMAEYAEYKVELDLSDSPTSQQAQKNQQAQQAQQHQQHQQQSVTSAAQLPQQPFTSGTYSMNSLQKQSSIHWYPDPEDVLDNPALSCYFLPLVTFTHEHLQNGQAYQIHLFGIEGLPCVAPDRYGEPHMWGFAYNGGKYRWLGDTAVFGGMNVSDVYAWLLNDFDRNCEYYMHERMSAADYVAGAQTALASIANFDARAYAHSVYSYMYTRVHYQRTGQFRHMNELTSDQATATGLRSERWLLDRLEAQQLGSSVLAGLTTVERHRYALDTAMIVGGAERFHFMDSSQGAVVAALNAERQHVYLLQ